MKGRTRKPKWGTLAFVLPIVVVAGAVAYGVLSYSFVQTGNLTVSAYTDSRYFPQRSLTAWASVGPFNETTPYTVSLAQGTYAARFSPLPGFRTPASSQAVVIMGKPTYVTGLYRPYVEAIDYTRNGFSGNNTLIIHNVTPVIWFNTTDVYITLQVQSLGTFGVFPHSNATYVFPTSGSFNFATTWGNATGVIHVS